MASDEQFGWFQIRAIVTISLVSMFGGSLVVFYGIFILYTPEHRCYLPGIDGDGNITNLRAVTNHSNFSEFLSPAIHVSENSVSLNECSYFRNLTFTYGNTSYNNATSHNCIHGWKYLTEARVKSATMEFNLVCNDAWLVPVGSSLIMFGYMTGAVFGGFLSDRWGRRKSLITAWTILTLSTITMAFIPVWAVSHVVMFLTGFSAVTRSTSGVVLINELTPEAYRYAAGTLNMAAMGVGYMLWPLLAYLLPNWRHNVLAVGIIQLLLMAPILCFVPESHNWLHQNKRYDEANKLRKRIRKVNKLKLDEAETADLDEKDYKQEEKLDEHNKSLRNLSYVHLMKYSYLRNRLIIFGFAFFAIVLCYTTLSLNTNNFGGSRYINCLLAGAVEIPGAMLCLFVMKRIGGRMSYIILTGATSICTLLTPLFQIVLNETSVVVLSMIGKLLVTGSLSILYIFIGDLFPTLLRTQAYGACSFVGRIAGLLVPFVVFLGERYDRTIPYFLPGSIALISAVGMYFLPETKSKPLPDTLEDAKLQSSYKRHVPCCGHTHDDTTSVQEPVRS